MLPITITGQTMRTAKVWQSSKKHSLILACLDFNVFLGSEARSGPHWIVPYSQNAQFTGRTSIMQRIKQIGERKAHNRIGLYGLGGSG